MASQQSAQSIEYSVYVFHSPKKNQKSSWEMKGVTKDMDQAMKSAEQFHDSDEYQKVEVKKKFFDEKNNRMIDMTLKTYESSPKKEMGVAALLGIAFVLCGIAFATAYFLTLPPTS